MKSKFFLSLALMMVTPLSLAQSKDFPAHPIKVVVPFTAGGGSDAAARYFSEKLSAEIGGPVVVENRPGGISGTIGTMLVKSAPADGYTLLVGSSSPLVVNALTVKNLPYNPLKDFKPISGLTKNTTVIVVAADSKNKTISDLVTTAKKNSQPMNVGTASAGFQLAANWFASLADFKYTHIPYKGLSQVLVDVAGHNLDWAVADLAGATPLIQSGKLRALAVTDEKRHPDFPNIPTVAESGYPEYIYNTWTSFHVRSETPDDVTKKLADAVQKTLATDDAKKYARERGTELLPLGPAKMLKFQKDEFDRFQHVAELTGVKPQ